ncbi:MAG: hypothetical protein M9965_21855, partial [Anaerolineae bacterium]|nr:hypothetical protein [Anaerolineae bacterium]
DQLTYLMKLRRGMDFGRAWTNQRVELLERYMAVNWLLLESLKLAHLQSSERREAIKASLLLPPSS